MNKTKEEQQMLEQVGKTIKDCKNKPTSMEQLIRMIDMLTRVVMYTHITSRAMQLEQDTIMHQGPVQRLKKQDLGDFKIE